MKILINSVSIAALCLSLAACGTDKETIVHEQPVVQERVIHDQAPAQPVIVQGNGMSPSSVESNCAHGYDNQSHSCY